jgi:hypothetical protein
MKLPVLLAPTPSAKRWMDGAQKKMGADKIAAPTQKYCVIS